MGLEQSMANETLETLLQEILKDGRVESFEKEALRTVTGYLRISKDNYEEMLKKVRASLSPDQEAGALNFPSFFQNLSGKLNASHDLQTSWEAMMNIAEAFGFDENFLRTHIPEKECGKKPKFQLCTREEVNYVTINLDNSAVRTEAGAMRYIRGNIEMESSAPSVGGFFKAAFTGETAFKPRYEGTGTLVLEPSLTNYFFLELDNEEFILDQGAYWASDDQVEVSAYRNKAVTALFSGEGWFQTSVKGKGTVVVSAPGPIEIIDLEKDRLVVDGSFAVARSSSLNFEVTRSTKSMWGSLTSGEGLVNTITGTGRVYLAPIPNRNLLLRQVLFGAMLNRSK